MSARLRGYKLCKECGQPMLKKGQKRKHWDDYRHASGCPAAEAEASMQRRGVAEAIARRLFTCGSRKRADRLRLFIIQPRERNLGGWSERAAADQIEEVLREHGL